jgi:transposase
VADRWHLLKNLREALELFLEQHRACLHAAANAEIEAAKQLVVGLELEGAQRPAIFESAAAATGQIGDDLSPSKAGRVRQLRREKRLERYQKVIELHQKGCGIREIARQIQIDRATVRKFIQAGEFPEIGQRRKMPSKLDLYNQYL